MGYSWPKPHFTRKRVLIGIVIIIPISLLTVLLTSGILDQDLSIAKTVVADSVVWNMSRPENLASKVIDVVEWVNSSYDDPNCGFSLNFSVLVVDYNEKDPGFPAYGNDYIQLRVDAKASIGSGYIHSIHIFSSSVEETELFHLNLHANLQLGNLDISSYNSNADERNGVSILVESEGHPKSAFLSSLVAYWVFMDSNAQSHSLELTAKTVYWNGTAYTEIYQPMLLAVYA